MFAIISILLFSQGFVVTRLALAYFDPLSLAFLRYLLASVVLGGVVIVFKIKPPDRKDWIWIVFCGLSGYSIYITLFKIASLTIMASTSSIIVAIVPIMTAVFAWIVYKERLNAIQCFAFVLAFSGILVMTLVNGTIDTNAGVLLMFVAAIFMATYNILTRKLVKKYSVMQVVIYSIFAATVALGVFIPRSIEDLRGGIPLIGFFYLFLLGFFVSAVAFITWSWAIKTAPKISYVTNFMFVTPFLTTVLGFFMANELPGLETLFGGILILSGLAIFNFHGSITQWLRKLAGKDS